jgi:hypothetical protein
LIDLKRTVTTVHDALFYADHHHAKLHVPNKFSHFAKRRTLTSRKPPVLSVETVRDHAAHLAECTKFAWAQSAAWKAYMHHVDLLIEGFDLCMRAA